MDVAAHSVGGMARHVGFVFQNPDHQIFCSTVRDEIGYGPRALGVPAHEVGERVDSLLEALSLSDVADAPPATLDYGARRAVAFASVLAMCTPVLVLDEPTACLDANLSERFLHLVDEANSRGVTVIMISHDMRAIARHCTHLLRMDRGHVAQWGAVAAPAARSSRGLQDLRNPQDSQDPQGSRNPRNPRGRRGKEAA